MLSLVDEIKKIVPPQDPNSFGAFLDKVVEYSEDSEFTEDRGSAKEFYDYLADLTKQHLKQLQDPNLSRKLDDLLLQLRWQALAGFDRKTKEQDLSDRVIDSIKNSIDIISSLKNYFDILEFDIGPDNKGRQILTDSLTHNQEILSSQSITLKSGDIVRGLVSNWLRDYISYTDPNAPRGASYELTQYLYSSPNAKKLVVADREMLAQIINIYNYLRYPQNVPKKLFSRSSQGTAPLPREVVKPAIRSNVEITPPPTAQPVATKPVAQPVVPVKPIEEPGYKPEMASHEPTAFEKRLAEASGSSGQHGVDLQVLRRQMEKTGSREQGTGSKRQITDNREQISENSKQITDNIVPVVKAIIPPLAPDQIPHQVRDGSAKAVADEIKREVTTPELPAHLQSPPKLKIEAPKPGSVPEKDRHPPERSVQERAGATAQISPLPEKQSLAMGLEKKPVAAPRPVFQPRVNATPPLLFSLDKIQSIDDLTKIELANLRQGPPLSQTQIIKSKVIDLVKANEILPYYVINAFEQSPLYKAYLDHGQALVSGLETYDMSQAEFEAIADLKNQLGQL